MKNLYRSVAVIGCALSFVGTAAVFGNDSKTQPRIGVYDSRAVAYANFWSESSQKKLKDMIASAKAAKESGDQAGYKAKETAIRELQDKNHRQVFSTAPVGDALESIKASLPEIQKQAKVDALVSKWDTEALKRYKNAEQVDVTDQLVRKFITPDEKQAKTIEEIKKAKPISPEKAEELIQKGKF